MAFAAGLAWLGLAGAREVYEYATTARRFEARGLIFEPSTHVDDDGLRGLLHLEPGTNILALDLRELERRVVEHPWVQHAAVVRHLPDTLEVSVEEHRPRAVLLAGHFYLVNSDGEPFKRVERGERGALPVITGVDRATLRDDRDRALSQLGRGLEVYAAYETKKRPRVGEIHLEDDGSVTLYTAESGTQLRLGRGEVTDGLERYDALRAALGEQADRLAVAHLDGGPAVGGRERIVARMLSARDDAVLLAQAAMNDAPSADPIGLAAEPDAPKPKKKRIPKYE